jgi:hypothetical protein
VPGDQPQLPELPEHLRGLMREDPESEAAVAKRLAGLEEEKADADREERIAERAAEFDRRAIAAMAERAVREGRAAPDRLAGLIGEKAAREQKERVEQMVHRIADSVRARAVELATDAAIYGAAFLDQDGERIDPRSGLARRPVDEELPWLPNDGRTVLIPGRVDVELGGGVVVHGRDVRVRRLDPPEPAQQETLFAGPPTVGTSWLAGFQPEPVAHRPLVQADGVGRRAARAWSCGSG